MKTAAFSALSLVIALSVATIAIADEKGSTSAGQPAPKTVDPPAATVSSTKRFYGLPEILRIADKNHPNIREARAQLSQVRAQLDEAHWAPFSQFKLTGGVAIAPQIQGNNIYSPNTDVSLTSSLGVAWKVGIDGVLPVWTFGKIGNLWDAAEANVQVHQADVEKQRDIVRLDVRRAYYALQLAHDAKLMLNDARSTLKGAEKHLEEKIAKGDGDPIDLLKLQTFGAELDVRDADADKFTSVALTGLRFYTSVPDLDIPDDPLAPPKHDLEPLAKYEEVAEGARPELMQARAGLAAREAQVRLAESNFYPDIGLGLTVGLSAAPEIADQLNPFVADPANYFHYGAALVFQWNLDFLPKTAQLRQAKAVLSGMHATQDYAEGGVKSEIQLAYADVEAHLKQRAAYQKATEAAKRWLIRVQQGIDVGTTEDKDLIDPAKAYALNRFNMLNSTMELDLAMAQLARASGWDAIAPDGT